ncbi:MAG: N-6 DNA methylase [Thermodesulfovibrio sp.]|nr:N-6 DNA methylase [Thermodesulfovibrio sp.]
MNSFPAIKIEGGLFSPDILEKLLAGEILGQSPQDFGIRGKKTLTDEIAFVFSEAHAQWDIFKRRLERLPEGDLATTVTRDSWMLPFLSLLGYEVHYNPRAYDVDGATFAISHRAGGNDDSPPIHIVGIRQELGRLSPTGRPRLSPHALVQEFLNRTEHLWGIVTNGEVLRILRESTYLRKQAYIEFDLRQIFEEKRFTEFAILYRLLHRSRLPKGKDDAKECFLEKYYQYTVEQGGRVREHLREGVEECLKILAKGFLEHPKNQELRDRLNPQYKEADRINIKEFYRQLLRLIYRFLFLLTSEDRGLISKNPLYLEHYSVSRLRRYVENLSYYTEHEDLWCSLRVLWKVLSDEKLSSLLEVSPLNGELFEFIDLDKYTIKNEDLLRAFWYLVYYQENSTTPPRRINYVHLDVEELGSVYESLLEYHPQILYPDYTFELVYGSERKSTGSYYTPPELVSELINSALKPVIYERLKDAKTKEEKEKAILSIKVCDPASGSGHFLLAAARTLGKELAKIRTAEDEPAPERVREAIRDVVSHCIYGVDKNPLAVELCKVSLWLEAHCEGKPLTFLDHRIKCGDSLIGILDINVLKNGIPNEAFNAVTEDERDISNLLKRINRNEIRDLTRGQLSFTYEPHILISNLANKEKRLEEISDDTPEDIKTKKRLYKENLYDPERYKLYQACNLWTSAFFQKMKKDDLASAIKTKTILDFLDGRADPKLIAKSESIAQENRFFHWQLEFPEVFEKGGFDVVLGNPPWERIKLQEKEFFSSKDSRIANAPNAAVRKQLIENLRERNPELWESYREALHSAECSSKFLRESGFYPLTGRGDINTYSVFAERMRSILKDGGRFGIIVPTGIATDDTNKFFFADLVEKGELVSLYDFENRKKLFPAVDSRMKFCLLTIAKNKSVKQDKNISSEFAFFCHEVSELSDTERKFTLNPEDFILINPNTKTAPIFRSHSDAELTKYIYRRIPVFVNENMGEEGNPWKVEFLRMFDMANDSHLFKTRKQLEKEGFALDGNIFIKGKERYLPLYEAKMIHQYDHRFGDFRDHPEGSESTQLPEVPMERLEDPNYFVLPRYWVSEKEVNLRLENKGWRRGWLLGWRNVTNATNERTVISTIIPRSGVSGKYSLVLNIEESVFQLIALLNSLVFDYFCRQKIGGTDIAFFAMKQLPIPHPSIFSNPCPWAKEETLADFCKPRILELVYTAWDLQAFAKDLGYSGPPFKYDRERRFLIKSELDAAFFHIYLGDEKEWEQRASKTLKSLFPTPRSAIEYILEQFPIVRRKDEEQFGEYRTKRVILEIYDSMNEAIKLGISWKSKLFDKKY